MMRGVAMLVHTARVFAAANTSISFIGSIGDIGRSRGVTMKGCAHMQRHPQATAIMLIKHYRDDSTPSLCQRALSHNISHPVLYAYKQLTV